MSLWTAQVSPETRTRRSKVLPGSRRQRELQDAGPTLAQSLFDGDRVTPEAEEPFLQELLFAAPPQSNPPIDGRDRLTGLIDRHTFLAMVDAALPSGQPMAVVTIGLDNFRHLNAGVGAATGDQVLTRVGQVLSAHFAPDVVARVGGDTFAVFLPHVDIETATACARAALAGVKRADVSATGAGIRVTASSGLTMLDRPGMSAHDCLQQSDVALVNAKATGRDRVCVHHAMESATVTAVHEWARRIRVSLDHGELVLHRQVVENVRGGPNQWELLVRLPVADGELMPPAEFLPIAQRFGLMQQVDELVTMHAIGLIHGRAAAGEAIRLEVNISDQTVASASFTELVEREVRASGIDPSCLVFEVNGSAAAAAPSDVQAFSQRLHHLGCRFALDNFGSNTGALEHLKNLPLDYVKIDGSFVRHLATSPKDQLIVGHLISLARAMGCQVIATSVGDDESRDLLVEMGVDFVQGFHVGRPEPLVKMASARIPSGLSAS